MYWDYFAYNTPLWKERVKKCNGKCDHKIFGLTFENDNDHEAFYETYNYEPDEQSKETQDKSIGDIDLTKWKKMVNYDYR